MFKAIKLTKQEILDAIVAYIGVRKIGVENFHAIVVSASEELNIPNVCIFDIEYINKNSEAQHRI